ncbi:uncharacterized protein ACJ7VT_017521 [Polymixia lowei]
MGQHFPRISQENFVVSEVSASIDQYWSISEQNGTFTYKTPTFRASVVVTMPPVPRNETWVVGWIQAGSTIMGQYIPRISQENIVVSEESASIDQQWSTTERHGVLTYKTPTFRASAVVTMPPVPRDETWVVGWIQACTNMKFYSTYGDIGMSSWEIPALRSGQVNAISNSNGVRYPWNGENVRLTGPTSKPSTLKVSMANSLQASVTWVLTIGNSKTPMLTHIKRDQSFITWLVAMNSVTKERIVLRTVRSRMQVDIAVDPDMPLGSRATPIRLSRQEQPHILNCQEPIPSNALGRPNANDAQVLMWRPRRGAPSMGAIFNLLEQHRLESYYNQFLQLGVKDERDFIDGISDEDLDKIGLTHVEKNRFTNMIKFIQKLRAPERQVQTVMPVQKSMEAFCLKYTHPQCPEPKDIRDMDPAQNTIEDLMLRICHLENVGNSQGVCLYTVDGMPLTDDPFFNTWSLKDRHIKNGDELYAIFTPKKNLKIALQMPTREVTEISGEDTIRCHIMLRGDFEVKVDLASDTITDLRFKLANESGIPAHVLHYKGEHIGGDILQSCGISEGSTVDFSLSTFCEETPDTTAFFVNDVIPSVQQTQKGLSVFLSSLLSIKMNNSGTGFKNMIGYIRKLTGCNPLAQSLYQLLCRNEIGTRNQKIAIVEGLYILFREILPRLGQQRGDKIIEDLDVFEHSTVCWAYLMSEAEKETSEHENYAPIRLTSDQGSRFSDPVNVPGIPDVFERADVLQKIEDGEKIPNCSEENLRKTSLKRDTDVEKILLSLPPSTKTYPVWISHGNITGQNFQINNENTFGNMAEGLNAFPHLEVTPPLILKTTGLPGPLLVLLSEDNLGVYESKDKVKPQEIKVFDCISGKQLTVDVNKLAAETGDHRDDHTFVTSRTPKEAILDHVRSLQADGCTVLYDALQHGASELEKVKTRFPDCRLRIICLTDGNDAGSTRKPVTVAAKLISSNIIVDSILLGNVQNNMLHGISNATGGCCFKPETSTDGLKLFEIETVLSLEMRKPKKKLDPAAITSESVLTDIFASHGYDEAPEISQPTEFNNKVTMTENTLKKKIQESKNVCFMEKDKRILEELKSLHCNPHPYFNVFPSESDFTFWKLLMQGPPDTPYEKGVFELYCQFGPDYPVKPPLVRFVTRVYHCNVNSVGRICHNILDRSYNAHITMREILDAIYGLLIIPEAEDPLDSILAEEFLTSREKYEQEAKKHTEETAGTSLDDMEKKMVGPVPQYLPQHLICPLTKRMFVDPAKTRYGTVYERKAIEKHLKMSRFEPNSDNKLLLRRTDLKQDKEMRKMVKDYRSSQILETRV